MNKGVNESRPNMARLGSARLENVRLEKKIRLGSKEFANCSARKSSRMFLVHFSTLASNFQYPIFPMNETHTSNVKKQKKIVDNKFNRAHIKFKKVYKPQQL